PRWLINQFPDARGFFENGGWLAILGVGGLLLLLLLWLTVGKLVGGMFARKQPRRAPWSWCPGPTARSPSGPPPTRSAEPPACTHDSPARSRKDEPSGAGPAGRPALSKLRVPRHPRERDHVADVAHPRHELHRPLQPQPEPRVRGWPPVG